MSARLAQRVARAGAVLIPVAAAMLVVRYRPEPRRLRQELLHPHAWIAAVGADSAAATLAGTLLWLAALWLCLGTSAAMLSLAPGRFGQVADLLARHALPSALRRVVITAAGASILMAPVSAFAAAGDSASADATSASIAAPVWPTDGIAGSISAPGWPTDGATPDSTTPDSGSAGTGSTGTGSAGTGSTGTGSTGTGSTGNGSTGTGSAATGSPAVTVRPGDSLWAIAGGQLGASATPARIATAWPRWYAANRAGVGVDPNLLRPGLRLHAPPTTPSNPKD